MRGIRHARPAARRCRLLAATVLAGAWGLPAAGAGGSGAPEIEEGLIATTLYVSPTGNDWYPGTNPVQPLATIGRAFDLFAAGSGGYRIVLMPGVYRPGPVAAREALWIPGAVSATRPLILEGAGWAPGIHTGDVVISGSDDWSGGWSVAGTENGRTAYEKAWPYAWGLSPNIYEPSFQPPDTLRTYHLVHLDGSTCYEVRDAADPTIANVAPGETYFYVDEAAGRIRIAPPAGSADLNARLVEVSVRRMLLRYFRSSGETAPTPFALRNVVFQHAAPGLGSGALRSQNHNGFIVEDCRFLNNKNAGMVLEGNSATTLTVRRCVVSGNGAMGAGFKAADALIEETRFENNSRQADVSQYYGWEYGGFKLGESTNVTFRGLVVRGNYGVGMWLDTGNRGILIEDCLSEGNTTTGLFIENNNRDSIPGLGEATTVEVRRTTLRDNRQTSSQNPVAGRGLYITESENVIIDDCRIHGNTMQVRISDGPQRGPLANIRLSGSDIYCTAPGQALLGGLGAASWSAFISTYSALSDANRWHDPASPIAFPDASRAVTLDLEGWRNLTGAEANSQWAPMGTYVEVILETSLDRQTWSPAAPGTYDITEGERHFRVRVGPR